MRSLTSSISAATGLALGAASSAIIVGGLGAFKENKGKGYRFNITANAALVTIFFHGKLYSLLSAKGKKHLSIRCKRLTSNIPPTLISKIGRGARISCLIAAAKTIRDIPMRERNGVHCHAYRRQNVDEEAIGQNGYSLEHLSAELQNDRPCVIEALICDGLALKRASKELRSDKEAVLVAVEQNGLALQYASKELRGDKKVVLAAVEQNGLAFEYVCNELKENQEVLMMAIKSIEKVFEQCNMVLKNLVEMKNKYN